MTREEEIFKAARAYNGGDTLSSHLTVIHFANGADWADEHPNLERLWHDAREVPQCEYDIICQDTLGDVWITHRRAVTKYYETGWEERAIRECIARWAYVSDLLPKGGKNENR